MKVSDSLKVGASRSISCGQEIGISRVPTSYVQHEPRFAVVLPLRVAPFREGRDRVSEFSMVLRKLPRRLRATSKESLRKIRNALTQRASTEKSNRVEEVVGVKSPKAVALAQLHHMKLPSYFSFPAENWYYIQSTQPIESSLALVRPRYTA